MVYLKFSQVQKIIFVVLMIVAQHPPLLAQKTPPPPDNGAPTQREGAATRGSCLQGMKRLTALVPLVQYPTQSSQNVSSGVVLGKTTDSHPSFWFYVPYNLTSEHPVEFKLRDEADNEIYQATLKGSETSPGVVGFQLPSAVPALQVGKRYYWFFSVYCTQEAPISVSGWVERVALNPSLVAELEQATPKEKVALYRKADLWHEAITALAQLRRQNPEDAKLRAEWLDLLQSVGLKAIALEPLTAMLTQTTQLAEPYKF
jgi:hypothetical protein